MASIRLRYFALQIFVILLALRSTTAYDVQGTKKFVVEVGNGFAGVEGSDHMKLENIDAVPTAPEVTNGKIGGRKMMMMKEGKLREVMKQEQAMINGEASTIPGAENSAGNCNLKVKELKINTKLGDRSIHDDDKVNVKMGSFMVFNSDYHVAKPHPPKNN